MKLRRDLLSEQEMRDAVLCGEAMALRQMNKPISPEHQEAERRHAAWRKAEEEGMGTAPEVTYGPILVSLLVVLSTIGLAVAVGFLLRDEGAPKWGAELGAILTLLVMCANCLLFAVLYATTRR
jgi:hypothetical protein